MQFKNSKILIGLLAVVLAAGLTGCWSQDKKTKGGSSGGGKPPSSGTDVNVSFDLRLSFGSATSDTADVFLLFDDTGSFSSVAPTVIALFPDLVASLITKFPDVAFAFGVGRFEDFGGPGDGFSGRSPRR